MMLWLAKKDGSPPTALYGLGKEPWPAGAAPSIPAHLPAVVRIGCSWLLCTGVCVCVCAFPSAGQGEEGWGNASSSTY